MLPSRLPRLSVAEPRLRRPPPVPRTDVPEHAGASAQIQYRYPSIKRRLASMVYESLLLCGLAFFAGLLFLGLTENAQGESIRHAFQLYLFLIFGLYFSVLWRQRGQTLAMKTWKLRLVGANGGSVSLRQALVRYICAWPCIALGGIGVIYACMDRDRQFLHDRLAGTMIVMTPDP